MPRIQARESKQFSLGEEFQAVYAELEEIDTALTAAIWLIRRVLHPTGGWELMSLAAKEPKR